MVAKKPKLGSGERFKQLTQKLERQGNSPESAKRIAASIGIKKYGAKRMAEMAAKGRKK
jgi:xanthine/CO dehydrogenase XdhC/CoxF family maturation factor